jgi:hypothetical protein
LTQEITKKLSFSVENVEMISENPNSNFALVSLDFFASGKNLHDMYVSEETLLRTAETIKNCPLVWKYDDKLDDAYTHDSEEVPCGFIPEKTEIGRRKLSDGRTMLSAVAYVWKKYTGSLLNFFKRDGGSKPISVEMSVFNSRKLANGLLELLDFKYEGVTVLGSFITPAIPLANATVLSFSEIKKEYDKVLKEEFPSTDMTIPSEIKENAKKGLELRKKYGNGGHSVSLAFAQYLIENEKATPEKIRHMAKHLQTHRGESIEQNNPPSNRQIDWLLWGGYNAYEWAESTLKELEKEEENKILVANAGNLSFPYKSTGEMNPALKGITPPITVSQANKIAAQADAIGGEYGWPTAIKHFKETHQVEDGKWVEKSKEEKMADEEIKKPEEMAVEEKKESPAEEKAESPAEEKKEKAEGTEMAAEEVKPEEMAAEEKEELPAEEKAEKKFEFPKNFNIEAMSQMFAEDEEEEVKMAKGEFAEPGIVMAGMFAKMCKMAEIVAKMAEENKAYMAENEELKKFKAEDDSVKKFAEVEKTLNELGEKVVIPEDSMIEFRASAENFSFEEIDAWKNECKAKSFDFATKKSGKEEIERIALPHNTSSLRKPGTDIWAGAK